ncbi:MAG: ATP-binding protein [Treponema sp.]|nr:ATP-binding protein [Treponema sp.]
MSKVLSFLHINRKLLLQFLVVFAAFSIMILISYFFASNIVRKHIASYGEEVITTSAEVMNALLSDLGIAIDNISFSIERLHASGAGIDAMRRELEEWTEWMHTKQESIDSSINFYGFLNGVFVDGSGWVPDSGFVPQERPWYLGAYAGNGGICYTDPYIDAETGELNLSVSKLVFDSGGTPFGVVAFDVYLSSITDFIIGMNFLGNGYGALLDSQRRFIIHHMDHFYGSPLESINGGAGGIEEMSARIAAGENLSAFSFISYDDTKKVIFFKQLFNGWYITIILPSDVYYKDLVMMQIIMSATGLLLALALCCVIAYMHIRVYKSDHASREKSTFLANMSHEIRTPMNTIIGMSEFLQHEKLSSQQMNFVNDINSSANSLLSIINDILDMSKIEAGKLSLVPVNFNFISFLDNIKSMMKYMADKKGLGFKFETSGEIPGHLYGDDVRLRQVLTNICGNAVKFTNKGYVSLSVTAANDKLLFAIEDTGRGIAKEELSKLFNAFEQINTKDNRANIGTGLGLFISKTYTEMMGGKIMVESEFGHGTIFIIEIPAVVGSAETILHSDQLNMEQTFSAPNARILVVDDNEINLKTVEALLGLFDIKSKTVSSGREAINLVQREDFDIVLMDHMMPDMDGIETTSGIRKLGGKFADLIIIALTANAIYGAQEMFLSNGFNGFISKPVHTDEFKKLLTKWLPEDKIAPVIQSDIEDLLKNADAMFLESIKKMFAKNNRDKHDEIVKALNIGDLKLAHRLAHTLKSNAAAIGKTGLQSAAADIEKSLREVSQNAPQIAPQIASENVTEISNQNTGNSYVSTMMLKRLEIELKAVLDELAGLYEEEPMPASNFSSVHVDQESLIELIEKLEPMFKNGDPECLKYVNQLRAIPGTGLLLRQMDEFDFENAMLELSEIKKRLI